MLEKSLEAQIFRLVDFERSICKRWFEADAKEKAELDLRIKSFKD